MSRYLVSIIIGGEAGFGIKNAGLTFARTINRAGYEVFGYAEYPSLVRGGHNSYQLTVADRPVRSAAQNCDLLVALNEETVAKHAHTLNPGSVIIYDKSEHAVSLPAPLRDKNIHLLNVPLRDLVRSIGGMRIMRNVVALGAAQAVLGLPLPLLQSVIKKTLGHKVSALEQNLKAVRAGYDHIKKEYPSLSFKVTLPVHPGNEELLLTGNDAIALGALAGGLQFYAAYPMTPSSSLLHYFAKVARDERLVVKHAEDEISVINMALGASHAGARAMIGTSGGGFSLMTESLGLAGITETPLVIVEAQRPGPATGLPTWTEQADLRFVMHAAQGEFPRIILAPGDHEEAFYLTADALNLADRYQMPVIILSDKFLSESERTVMPFDERRVRIDRGVALTMRPKGAKNGWFPRYKMTATGVSPRSVPGTPGGMYLANSDEHDTFGFSTEEADMRIAMVKKRAEKFDRAAGDITGYTVHGNPRAKYTVVGWGSTKGPILDAMAWLPPKLQRHIKLLHLHCLWPFPSPAVHQILSRSKKTLLVENNATAQLGGLIRQYTGHVIDHKLLKYDGRPIYPSEIKERIMAL